MKTVWPFVQVNGSVMKMVLAIWNLNLNNLKKRTKNTEQLMERTKRKPKKLHIILNDIKIEDNV